MRAARVVVVCSQAWVGRLVAGALEARALHVAVYTSTTEALVALRPPVDLLVCDAALEGGPADLIGGLRASDLPGPVPVLCLVPDEPSGGRLLALQAGVDACISQPFRVDELVAQVEALLAFVVRTHSSVPPGRPTVPPQAAPRPTLPPPPTRPPPPSALRSTPAQRVGPGAVPPASQHAARASSPAPHRRDVDPPPAACALEGDLAHVSLSTVLTLLEMERRSGVIAIDDGGRQAATIDLCLGSPVGGSLGGGRVAPLAVLRRVLAWPQGRFRFQPGAVGDLRTGTRSLGALLMEAMRLADESAAMAAADEASGDGGGPAKAAAPSTRPRGLVAFEERPGSARPAPRPADTSPPPSARLAGSPKSSFPPPVLV